MHAIHTGAALALALLVTSAAAAQTTTTATGVEARGCRGDQIRFSTNEVFGGLASYPLVTGVQPGSPAAVAGLQVGDTLVSQGGVDLLAGNPPRQRLAPGDTVRMGVGRAGGRRDLVLVLGTRDGATQECRPAPRR